MNWWFLWLGRLRIDTIDLECMEEAIFSYTSFSFGFIHYGFIISLWQEA